MTRDLFESILYHALQAEVDMEQTLRYPLTPVHTCAIVNKPRG